MFDGSEYLVIIDYYSKMPIVRKMLTLQCNSAKTITVLKELFAEHGIPEEIWSDNGPQFASHLFAQFTKDWNIKHSTSSPRNPRSNGKTESAVKIVKGLLTRAKCSGQDPYLALLAYRGTPVDSHLRSHAKMLYQCALRTTVPQRIRHKDPYAAAELYRLPQESPTLCRTICFCNQQWQDTVAPCHYFTWNRSWLIHRQSHWWSWIQMSTRPHLWTSPRCCQA